MAFLTKAELKTVATIPIIDKLTATDDSRINPGEFEETLPL